MWFQRGRSSRELGDRSGGSDGNGDAVEDSVARKWIDGGGIGENVDVDAGMIRGDPLPRSGKAVAPAVRDADDAGHDGVGQLHRDVNRAGGRAYGRRGAVQEPETGAVVRVDLGDAAV